MPSSKNLFMDAHEALIEDYLERRPNADWSEVYDRTADAAYGRMQDTLADKADALRQRLKDEGR